jgi:membrane-bound lytic murein transglycosylase B
MARAQSGFGQWLESLWPEAQAQGVSRRTFDAATRGLTPDLSLPDLAVPGRAQSPPRGQAEFVQTPAEYIRESRIARLADHGRKLLAQHKATLVRIDRAFGVPPAIILAIWGRETDFGRYKNSLPALRVLATQAFYGRR